MGEHRNDGSHHAFIKVLREQDKLRARKRFVKEVAVYSTLEHEGLPKLIEDNADEWRHRSVDLYLVLELIEGVTLGDFIRRDGSMPLHEAIECILAISRIVEGCHDEEVVHRDHN